MTQSIKISFSVCIISCDWGPTPALGNRYICDKIGALTGLGRNDCHPPYECALFVSFTLAQENARRISNYLQFSHIRPTRLQRGIFGSNMSRGK
jgi:hypothetical protein